MFGLWLLDPDIGELTILLRLRHVGDTSWGEYCCILALLLDRIRLVDKRRKRSIALNRLVGAQ
jgi:hypothetical protein